MRICIIMTAYNQWIFVYKLFNIYLVSFVLQVKFVSMKIYERCELANELHDKQNITNLIELAQWVCIAEQSSGLNTATKGHNSHGLFAISEVFWCSPSNKLGLGCNMMCSQLRDNDLTDDLICAKIIYDEHERLSGNGFTAWPSYQGYCLENSNKYIENCFDSKHKSKSFIKDSNVPANAITDNDVLIKQMSEFKKGKIYERCELVRDLYEKYDIPLNDVSTWLCIVEYESNFNTSAMGGPNYDGSLDYGLFQVNDKYWCFRDNQWQGYKACDMPCNHLLDNDITDDVQCIKRIHKEHAALTGDGFKAWSVYEPYCRNQHYEHIKHCFSNIESEEIFNTNTPETQLQPVVTSKYSNNPFLKPKKSQKPKKTFNRKIWTRCSLAQELFSTHKISLQNVATWVCIAEDASQFDIGLMEGPSEDGSISHGLFQISDRYWCSNNVKDQNDKACRIPCSQLRDQNLNDDIQCIRTIYNEHQRLTGNGFNAWSFYKQHCHIININYIEDCFEKSVIENSLKQIEIDQSFTTQESIGKVYEQCELAQELYFTHAIPFEQLSTWICIAKHESNFNTASIGRLNSDGSLDHGLFQISDLYWCTHNTQGGKGCQISCNKLLDNDIADDIQCITRIYDEHTRISGNGFNAWTVYEPYCKSANFNDIQQCFTNQENIVANADANPIDHTNKVITTSKNYIDSSTIRKTDKIDRTSTTMTATAINTNVHQRKFIETSTENATTKLKMASRTTPKQRSSTFTTRTTKMKGSPYNTQQFTVNTLRPTLTHRATTELSSNKLGAKESVRTYTMSKLYNDWSWQIANTHKSNYTNTETNKRKSVDIIHMKSDALTEVNKKSSNVINSAYNWALYGQRKSTRSTTIPTPSTTTKPPPPTTTRTTKTLITIGKSMPEKKHKQETTAITSSTMSSLTTTKSNGNNPFDHPFFDKHRKLFEN